MRLPRAIADHRAVWLTLSVVLLYFLGYALVGSDITRTIMNALVVGVAVSISLQWGVGAVPALMAGARDSGSRMVISMWLMWFTTLVYFVWIVYFTASGRPEWMRDLPVSGFLYTMFFTSGVYAIFAPVTTTNEAPTPAVGLTIVAIVIGSMAAGAILAITILGIVSEPPQ